APPRHPGQRPRLPAPPGPEPHRADRGRTAPVAVGGDARARARRTHRRPGARRPGPARVRRADAARGRPTRRPRPGTVGPGAGVWWYQGAPRPLDPPGPSGDPARPRTCGGRARPRRNPARTARHRPRPGTGGPGAGVWWYQGAPRPLDPPGPSGNPARHRTCGGRARSRRNPARIAPPRRPLAVDPVTGAALLTGGGLLILRAWAERPQTRTVALPTGAARPWFQKSDRPRGGPGPRLPSVTIARVFVTRPPVTKTRFTFTL